MTKVLYLSSADWMNRNMLRRIETGLAGDRPAHAPAPHRRMPGAYLHDGQDAWDLQADGHYERVNSDDPAPAPSRR
jgi:polyphosphate kinase